MEPKILNFLLMVSFLTFVNNFIEVNMKLIIINNCSSYNNAKRGYLLCSFLKAYDQIL